MQVWRLGIGDMSSREGGRQSAGPVPFAPKGRDLNVVFLILLLLEGTDRDWYTGVSG